MAFRVSWSNGRACVFSWSIISILIGVLIVVLVTTTIPSISCSAVIVTTCIVTTAGCVGEAATVARAFFKTCAAAYLHSCESWRSTAIRNSRRWTKRAPSGGAAYPLTNSADQRMRRVERRG